MTSATTEIRCPHCGKKLGDYLVGLFMTICPRCKQSVVLDNRKKV